MKIKPRLGILGIGDSKNKGQESDYQEIISFVEKHKGEIIDYGIGIKAGNIKGTIKKLSHNKLDLLILVCLQGQSAQVLKSIAEKVDCPCLIWATKGGWAWSSSALAIGAIKEKRKDVKIIYGSPKDPDIKKELGRIISVAVTISRLKDCRIGKIGGLFPNLVSCKYGRDVIKSKLGVELVDISFREVKNTMDKVSEDVKSIKKFQKEIENKFVIAVEERVLIKGIILHLALKKISQKNSLGVFAIECWRRFPEEIGLNPCFGFVADDYLIACEGDVLTGTCCQIARSLTGISPYVGDIFDLDKRNVLSLLHCGAPASLKKNERPVVISESIEGREKGFPAPTCYPEVKRGVVTVLRLYGRKKMFLHMVKGELIDNSIYQGKFMVKVNLNTDRKKFIEDCLGNHYVIVPANVEEEMKLLCNWLDIHLVGEEKWI